MFKSENYYPHKICRPAPCTGHDAQHQWDKSMLECMTKTFLSRLRKYRETARTGYALTLEQKEQIRPYLESLIEEGWNAEFAKAILLSTNYDTKSLDTADAAFKSIGVFSREHGLRCLHKTHIAMHYIGEMLEATAKTNFNPAQPRHPAGTPDGGRWSGGDGLGNHSPERESPLRSSNRMPTKLPDRNPSRPTQARPIQTMSTTRQGVQFVATHEWFKPEAYDDGSGNLTIGYGHVIQSGESFPNGMTKSQATKLLAKDMKIAEERVKKYVRIDLKYHEFDALTSFTFNAGTAPFREQISPGKYRDTKLLIHLNKGEKEAAANEFLKYNKATNQRTGKKEPLEELTTRRKKERDMFLHGLYKHKEVPD